jgi:hypothetical protein
MLVRYEYGAMRIIEDENGKQTLQQQIIMKPVDKPIAPTITWKDVPIIKQNQEVTND